MGTPKSQAKREESKRAARFTGLTQLDCATVLGISKRHFAHLVSLGVFPAADGKAGYELSSIVGCWTKYVENGRSPTDSARAKIREILADVRLKEARAEALEGGLLDREGTRRLLSQMAVRLAAALDGVAGRVAGEVCAAIGGERAIVREIIFREHRKIREAMASSLEDLIAKPEDA